MLLSRSPLTGFAASLLAFAVVLAVAAPAVAAGGGTYTLCADFDLGVLLNTNHDIPAHDQVQLNAMARPLPFLWVPLSGKGTVVRIDVASGQVLGEYRSAPEGCALSPSRTTVDLWGCVWTTNRHEQSVIDGDACGSAVKIGLISGGTRVDAGGAPDPLGDFLAPPFDFNSCRDRDGDGLIKTSRGLGDVRPWPDVTDGVGGVTGLVEDADDECILIYQRLPGAPCARHVSVDAANDVWVAGYPHALKWFLKLDGETGAIVGGFDAAAVGCGGYGGFIDGDGILWSASVVENRLLRYDTTTGIGSCIECPSSYGLGIGPDGYVWNTMFGYDFVAKIDPAGNLMPGFPKPTGGASGDRGVAVTPADGDVWVANSFGTTVSRLTSDGLLRALIPVGLTPTGVAVDSNGKVWVTNMGSDDVMRIDPAAGPGGLGAVDLTVPLGAGAAPYTYSDMTGIIALGITSPQGNWTVVHDGGLAGMAWGQIRWNDEPEGFVPPSGSLTVAARAADVPAGLASQPWTAVLNGGPLALAGRYVEVRATLKAADDGTSPVLSDLTLEADNQPPECEDAYADPAFIWPPNHRWVAAEVLGVTDPDGDPLAITIDAIYQDEPVDTYGDGRFTPDATGVGSAGAAVRAERAGSKKVPGNGRVYHLFFTADDGAGGVCTGEVLLCVPHDRGHEPACIDDGALYDSTALAP